MSVFTYIRKHSVVSVTIAIIAVVIAIVSGRVAARSAVGSSEAGSIARQVSLVDVSSFRNGTSTVRTDGLVESVSQVDLKSQASAPIAKLNVVVGQSVSAGEILLELQNDDIKAQLEQARASLSLAEGQYNTSGVTVASVRKSAIDAVRQGYISADGVVRGQIDQFLFNTSGGQAPLISYISDYKLSDRVRGTRTDLDQHFADWKSAIDGLSASASSDADIRSALSMSKEILDVTGDLLDDLSFALNDAVNDAPSSTVSTLNGWKVIVSAAREIVAGANSGITASDAALLGALSAHGSPAEAQVSVAAAGMKALEAQLDKTIVRSPISGRVAALPLRAGEFAPPGQLLATVVGGGSIQVKAYISGDDLSRVAKGVKALIHGAVAGTVMSVAPSVNQTNKKVEVKILVSDADKAKLVIGQNVSVSIEASGAPVAEGSVTPAAYVLPIQNIKIIPGDAYVFTVDADSKVVKHSVVLGKVDGDFIEVKEGLLPDMKIVSPVYELEEGQVVDVR